ncbi:MAG: adenylosuccinate synthetase, partial [Clostridia bacterium]|nr:adenylosuccinate synthetase [Clostridia bacterium]
KAYSTCVGEGLFVGELVGDAAHDLREAGHEYGAATGRPRRVAWLDLVATRYGVKLQGATELAFTKLDVLSYLKEIPVCVAYEVNGRRTDRFPYTPDLDNAVPVYETLPGWACDISGCRAFEDLPKAAQDYVLFAEKALGVKFTFVSVGAEREQLIIR